MHIGVLHRCFRACVLALWVAAAVSVVPAQQPPPVRGGASSARKVPVEFAEARSQHVGNTLSLPGSTISPRKADVASSIAGLVKEVHFEHGQTVAEGDLLAVLDVRSLAIHRQTLIARAREASVRMESARSRFNRASELFEAKLISAEQLDQARFDHQLQEALVETLKSEIAETEHTISLSEIRAPFAGVVSRKLTEVGQWLKVGDPLLSMVSLDQMSVVVELPELYLGVIRMGLTAKVHFEALGKRTFAGTVIAIFPEASADARTFPVHLAVANPARAIRAGMLGQVEFQSSNMRSATVVPKDALVRTDSGHVVFVIGEGEKVLRKPVQPGNGAGLWVDVGGSLRPGDRVVTRGNERLADGQLVAARRQE